MKPEGYAIIPDGRGLALTAASASGIFYALQTVKQLIEIIPGDKANAPPSPSSTPPPSATGPR